MKIKIFWLFLLHGIKMEKNLSFGEKYIIKNKFHICEEYVKNQVLIK